MTAQHPVADPCSLAQFNMPMEDSRGDPNHGTHGPHVHGSSAPAHGTSKATVDPKSGKGPVATAERGDTVGSDAAMKNK